MIVRPLRKLPCGTVPRPRYILGDSAEGANTHCGWRLTEPQAQRVQFERQVPINDHEIAGQDEQSLC